MASKRKIFDFTGWATRHNIRCSDGRTIKKDAFKDDDGSVVPLIWQHNHDDPAAVIGHALLENRDEGVYAYCALNSSEKGLAAKEAVKHGDITALSIFANHLQQSGGDVLHGEIREVSLVHHGANPGAFIDNVMIHGDMNVYQEEGFIYNGELLDTETQYELVHADDDTDDEDDEDVETSEKTVQEVYDEMTDEQKAVAVYIANQVAENLKGEKKETKTEENDSAEHSDIEGGNNDMRQNVFDKTMDSNDESIKHAEFIRTEFPKIIEDAKNHRYPTLKDSFLAHQKDYGIKDNVSWLFPDYKTDDLPPQFIKRDDDWVSVFLNAARKSPFSRIKSIFADITKEEARAKGYVTAAKKVDEVIELAQRTTEPTTIYKKQKLDRDDIIDITDFDVLRWLKMEMDMLLKEELARACLISDGRSSISADKIKETNIRPISKDDELYTIKVEFKPTAEMKDKNEVIYSTLIDEILRGRKGYKGTGNPIFFTTEDVLTEMLLLKDGVGRRLYKDQNELATALRVSRIVTVEPMENTFTDPDTNKKRLVGVIVNPVDYQIGATRGGQTTFFEDFDIDFNQQKYLLETRCSGALIRAKSAIAVIIDETDITD